MTLNRNQLRAARAMLGLTAGDLAARAGVGIATVRRFEAGADIGRLHLDAIQRAVEAAGIVLIANGSMIDGHPVGFGVALSQVAPPSSESSRD